MKLDETVYGRAVKTALEKKAWDNFGTEAIPGGRDVIRKLFYRKHKGPHTEPYSGGFGEVRRWQKGKPSEKDPEKYDIVQKQVKHPPKIKRKEVT